MRFSVMISAKIVKMIKINFEEAILHGNFLYNQNIVLYIVNIN